MRMPWDMIAGLAVFSIASSPATAGPAAPSDEEPGRSARQCAPWFAEHGARGGAGPGRLLVFSPALACFDGTIERDGANEGTEALAAWAAIPATGEEKLLVIRSHGGDAAVAITIAEELQSHNARVFVSELCASSCANYFYAGLPQRYVGDGALVLFHGGLSDGSRERISRGLDELYAEAGDRIDDPKADRARLLAAFDSTRERQDRLLRRAGADPALIHGVDAANAADLPAESCGGDTDLPRNFVYFDFAEQKRLGIAPLGGTIETRTVEVNERIAELTDAGRSFVACRLVIHADG